jgi:ABC-2 type transport system permease protein
MKKIWVIVQREYITRVRNKTFLLSTFLFPILLIGVFIGSAYLSKESSRSYRFAVQDATGQYMSRFKNEDQLFFYQADDCTPQNFKEKGYDGLLQFYYTKGAVADSVRLFTAEQTGLSVDQKIIGQIAAIEEGKAMESKGISSTILDSIQNQTKQSAQQLYSSYIIKGDTLKEDNKALAYGIGFASGFIIYLTLFIYGASVMRGVMEEKMNRIAEVMVSSVKPFQLMMGKIIGIAAVGLTQLLLWVVLLSALSGAGAYFLSPETIVDGNQALQNMPQQNAATAMSMGSLDLQNVLLAADWGVIISLFLFYFIGGYLFYAALFAAIGSVINEDPQEAQSLMMPITMPIIFGFIMMTASIENPTGNVAFWGSIIPFTSPMVMMARIPSGIPENVPYWQLAISMVLLIAGFLGTTWLSGKIYRTGILMYGKKASWKEMIKWVFRKA